MKAHEHPHLRGRVVHPVRGESRTIQSDAMSTDINSIMSKYQQHGVLPRVNAARPRYGDFSSALDYHSSLSRVLAAQDEFMSLPSSVRKAVDNDPGKFLDLVTDPDRREELEKLGLLEAQLPPEPEPEPDPQPAEPAAPPAEPTA